MNAPAPPPRVAPRPPFFVVGSGRSGTTLLRIYLNAHSQVAIPSESWFLTQLLKELPADRPLSLDEQRRALRIVKGHERWQLDWDTPPQALDRLLDGGVERTLAELVDEVFRLEVAASGKPAWADKTPPYVGIIPELARLFPGARFVHVVRDGRDVTLSYLRVGWGTIGRTPYGLAHYWAGAVRMGALAAEELGPEVVMHLAYEDLVLDTRAALERVCAFLDLPFEPAMLDAHRVAYETIAERELVKNIHPKLGRPPRPEDAFRWKRARPRTPVLLAWPWLSDGLARFGYESPRPPVPGWLLAPASWLQHRMYFLRRALRNRMRGARRRLGRRR